MSFLIYQKQNPEFLNNYLKYKRYIELSSETTVNETYFDLRTLFRYLKLCQYKEINIDTINIEEFKKITIKDITIEDISKITKNTIEQFINFLNYVLNNSPKTRNRKLASIKKFFEYLSNNNYIVANPTKFVKTAQIEKRLPKYLNLENSKKLLSATAKIEHRNKIRNYTIICLFLNCCLRLSELVNININDIKLDDRTLKVTGKGNKDRITYLNDAVIEALKMYLEIRPNLDKTNMDYNALFLSERKKRISRRSVQSIIENELKKAFHDVKKGLHTHSLRHTGATLLYNENNVSILIIQKILGHKHLSSTEIYTHVSNKKLKEIMENSTISSIIEKMEESNNGKL